VSYLRAQHELLCSAVAVSTRRRVLSPRHCARGRYKSKAELLNPRGFVLNFSKFQFGILSARFDPSIQALNPYLIGLHSISKSPC
jgi:hypothetical protein